MTDDLPKIFAECTPQPAPAALRLQTLAAVERQLARRRVPRWERALELAVAASLVLGIGLNTWLWQAEGPWQPRADRLAGAAQRRAVAHENALAAKSAGHKPPGDKKSARSAWHGPSVAGNDRYQRLLHELSQGRIPDSL
jgi:hypothetical protein